MMDEEPDVYYVLHYKHVKPDIPYKFHTLIHAQQAARVATMNGFIVEHIEKVIKND